MHNSWYISIYISYEKCDIHYGTDMLVYETCPKSIDTKAVFIKAKKNKEWKYVS